jgi:hypothetical protein
MVTAAILGFIQVWCYGPRFWLSVKFPAGQFQTVSPGHRAVPITNIKTYQNRSKNEQLMLDKPFYFSLFQ